MVGAFECKSRALSPEPSRFFTISLVDSRLLSRRFLDTGWDLIPPQYAPAATDAFQNFCEVLLKGCGFDPATLVCTLSRPDEAEFGGTLYQNFLKVVIAAIVLRVANELASFAVVANCLRLASLQWWGGTVAFVRDSSFAPLLRFVLSRDEFYAQLVQPQFNHRELAWRFARSALMIGTQQVVNLYFVVRIAQAGLEATTLLTLLKEWLQILFLVGRVVFSWCTHVRLTQTESEHTSPQSLTAASDKVGAIMTLPSGNGFSSTGKIADSIELDEIASAEADTSDRLAQTPVSRPPVDASRSHAVTQMTDLRALLAGEVFHAPVAHASSEAAYAYQ
jgi:hypothetical protein